MVLENGPVLPSGRDESGINDIGDVKKKKKKCIPVQNYSTGCKKYFVKRNGL